ncbi:monovalent cation/H(+) antiporter subunit G [Robiginitomaculum antarcticum]|uniref:monovalent cation/H(+) antiporter subunit G n=1 Tax=Robiginitomaculum antarcticum TaxID=437507 RepID=UPI0003A0E273|nr:monovalent cation/H(+) antiporter subunit G [Robiginitomaculum antarcticum]
MAEPVIDTAVPASGALPWIEILEWGQALLSGGLILTGTFFVLAGAIGVLRMPDFFTRIHAAGMTDTMGAEFILLGLVVQAGFTQLSLKLLLVAFFLFVTSPTATHAIAHAAHLSGLKPRLGRYQAPDLEDIGKGDRS